jgi:hypothetical protein
MSYNNINYISYRWISDDPAAISKADKLTQLYRAEMQPKRKNKRPFNNAFNVILTAIEMSDTYSGRLIHVPTNNNIYKGKTKRSSPYATEILDALKWLIANSYLKQMEGIKLTVTEPGELPRELPFAYKLSSKWLKEIASAPLSDPSLIRRNGAADYVELRDKVKKQSRLIVPTTKDLEIYGELIEQSGDVLRQYDNFMKGVVISLGSQLVPSAKSTMTRIFSRGSYEKGGRLYSAIQNLKKVERPYLYFDGEPTIEIDYKSLHPHMLYHQERLEFPNADPYEIEGFDRDTVKTAFNTMINRGGKGKSKSAANSLSWHLDIDGKKARELEGAILLLHEPIRHHFNTGVGLRLQRLDSDIAMEVIDAFINVKKRPIIGVHDSFIVSVRDASALNELMGIAYNKYFNSTADISIIMNEEEGVGSVEGWVGMGGLSETKLEFSEDLERAIWADYAQTDGMDKKFWDELLAKEPVQEP